MIILILIYTYVIVIVILIFNNWSNSNMTTCIYIVKHYGSSILCTITGSKTFSTSSLAVREPKLKT